MQTTNLMLPTFRLSLVRHGAVHNPDGILYGRLPRFRLSSEGRRQAQAAGLALARDPFDTLFSSPLLRARQTATEIAKKNGGHKFRITKLLNEVYTGYQGCPEKVIDARCGDIYTGAEDTFEQPEDIVARATKFIRRLRAGESNKHVVAVTHGDVIAFVTLWAAGMSLLPKNKANLAAAGITDGYPATGSITTYSFFSTANTERPRIQYARPYPYRGD